MMTLIALLILGQPQPGKRGPMPPRPPKAEKNEAQESSLSTTDKWSLEMIENFRAQQEHVQIVSNEKDEDVKKELQSRGYALVGGLIDTGTWHGTRTYVATKGKSVIVVFRGSHSEKKHETIENTLTDANSFLRKIDWLDPSAKGYDRLKDSKVHNGFGNEYGRIRDKVIDAVKKHSDKTVFVFGHSLGGALATLCGLDIRIHLDRPAFVYVSGCPRVGNSSFRQAYERLVPLCVRLVFEKDVVPRRPGWALDYVHIGGLLMIRKDGTRVPMSDVETDPGNGNWKDHDNSVYYDAIKAFEEHSKKNTKIFEDADYPQKLADKERQVSK